MAPRFLVLRYPQATGGARIWAVGAIAPASDGDTLPNAQLVVWEGKEGDRLKKTVIPRRRWVIGDEVQAEGFRLVREKQAVGYDVAGVAAIEDGVIVGSEFEQRETTMVPLNRVDRTLPSAKDAGLFWQVQAPNWTILKSVMTATVQRCEAAGLAVEWVSYGKLPSAVPKVGDWMPTFPGHSGIGRVNCAESVLKTQGILPAFFLLAMRAEAGLVSGVTVSLADAENQEIGTKLKREISLFATFGTEVEEHRRLLEDLDLLPRVVRLAEVETGVQNFFF